MRCFRASVLFLILTAILIASAVPSPAQEDEIDFMPGRLSLAHEGLEDPDGCDNCHDDDLNVDGDRCLACHDLIAGRMAAEKGVHREATVDDCAVCHAEHQGREADLRPIDPTDFDHAEETGFAIEGYHGEFAGDCSNCHTTRSFLNLTPDCTTCHEDVHKASLGDDCTACHSMDTHFRNASRGFHKSSLLPLEGRHLDVPCASCHWNGVTKGTPTTCYDCHWIRRQDDLYRTNLGVECEKCHEPVGWVPAKWNHEANTGFPIGGQHQTVDCVGCHPDRRFDGPVAPDCYSCHRGDYESAREPDHVAAGFPTQCEVCHRPNDISWNQAVFNHDYSLRGQHATADCAACHGTGIYAGTPRNCVGCHLTDYEASTNPDHSAAGFPATCNFCHHRSDSSWQDADFDHPFPLSGVHGTLDCSSCHGSGVYAGTPTDCVGCHLDDYQDTEDPDHGGAGFPTDCEQCHQPTTWTGATVDHTYSLVGVHATLDCSACHSSGVYAGLPSDCVDCHLDNYNTTANPNHSAAGFSTTCDTCHQQSDPNWLQATYPHTVWPLVGSHRAQECSSCHTRSVYAGLPSECVDCHLDDYNATTDPDHASAGFPTSCEQCHQPTTWTGATFAHTYSLVGVHATLDCSACHSSGVYAGLPSDCVDCHLDNYNATSDPNHAAAGFPTTCDTCHQQADPDWFQATYPHTVWPLVGSHTTLQCSSCHTGSVFAGLPSECVDCHLDDYNATTDPDHASAGFPTSCETCHQPTTWTGATFDHTYSLEGAHRTLDCSACHSSGVYAGLPSDCVDCHLDDYNTTSNPNHTGAGFPTDCELCHRRSDMNWFQGDFDHTYFPITSGKHAGTQCVDCHTDPANYRIFSCLDAGCHPRDEMDDEHEGKTGYVYDSVVCYSCHPDGKKPPDARYRLGPGRG